jgi:hypothetical protein
MCVRVYRVGQWIVDCLLRALVSRQTREKCDSNTRRTFLAEDISHWTPVAQKHETRAVRHSCPPCSNPHGSSRCPPWKKMFYHILFCVSVFLIVFFSVANPSPRTGDSVANHSPRTGNSVANHSPRTGDSVANHSPRTGDSVANHSRRFYDFPRNISTLSSVSRRTANQKSTKIGEPHAQLLIVLRVS